MTVIDIRDRDSVMRRVYNERGLAVLIAREIGISPKAVQQWKKVPPEHVMTLVHLLKMKPEDIRPDIFRKRHKVES